MFHSHLFSHTLIGTLIGLLDCTQVHKPRLKTSLRFTLYSKSWYQGHFILTMFKLTVNVVSVCLQYSNNKKCHYNLFLR